MVEGKSLLVGWGKPAVASLILLSLSCEERIHDPIALKPPDSTAINRWPWEDIGLNNKYPMRMVKSGAYVYVAARVGGIWRLDGEDRWKYLGLKDTVAGQTPYGGVLSLDISEGELFAGLHCAISIDSNQRVGVWRMGLNSSEWVLGDSGIRVQEWASSAVLDVVRSPANPQLMVTGPGSIYQSSNGEKVGNSVIPITEQYMLPSSVLSGTRWINAWSGVSVNPIEAVV